MKKERIEKQCIQLQQALDKDLEFVCTYENNTKVCVVLSKISQQIIAKLAPFVDKQNTLLLRKKDIENGQDVFAVDFLHIMSDYEPQVGNDPFKKMLLDKENIRFHVEFSLRSKLIVLYQRILHAQTKKEKAKVIEGTEETLLPIVKAMVFLKEPLKSQNTLELLEQVEPLYNISSNALTKTLTNKMSDESLQIILDWLTEACKAIDSFDSGVE